MHPPFEETRDDMGAQELVAHLIQMSFEPDMDGEDAIAAWRTEAAEHGDDELVAAIDEHDPEQLARLWDYGCGGAKC